jgi:septum formation protein
MALILASASPRRKELLLNLKLCFNIEAADIDETILEGLPPQETVMRLAREKAEWVQKKCPEDIIIGADTIVVLDSKILGKPEGTEQAKEMLRQLSGRKHEVYSGVAVLSPERSEVFFERSTVTFYNLKETIIARYVATGEPLDKAGSYGIQQYGALLVKSIEGDYFNIVGLPISRLCQCLEAFGVSVL